LAELAATGKQRGITGMPVELVAMTQDGMARWTEDEPGLTG
jgi:hypothetical protein